MDHGRRVRPAGCPRRPHLRAFGLQVLLLILAFLAAEGLLRVYFAVAPASDDSPYIRDAYCGYRLRPDPPAVREERPDDHINAFGFRDREHEIKKPEDTYRVLGIGDSFVYGNVPLEDNFLRVTEERLSRHLAPDSLRAEMVLMGLGGYSPENELGVLRSDGLKLSPDLVVLNFFVGNDVTGIAVRGVVCRGQLYYAGSNFTWLHILRQSRIFLLAETVWLTRIKSDAIQRQLGARADDEGRAREPRESAADSATGSPEAPVSLT